jgi:chemotaxis protein CheZ
MQTGRRLGSPTMDGTQASSPASGHVGTDLALLSAAIGEAVRQELAPLLADMQRFIDRRIAELSAEVHGTTQLLGYSEDNLSGQLTKLQQQMAELTGAPTEATRNSGMELEMVVKTTEAAANRIMEAAESIGDLARGAKIDDATIRHLNTQIDTIFEACAFQDLTGQRIRRAIEQLQHMESALTGIITPSDDHVVLAPPKPTIESTGADVNPSDIDSLFD